MKINKIEYVDPPINLSTWQSIFKKPKPFFKDYRIVFGDEAHLYKAKSLTSILEKLENCPVRIGTTGTLDGSDTNKLILEGLFGPVYNVTSTHKLMKDNHISDLKIKNIVLKYPERLREHVANQNYDYKREIDLIIGHPERNKIICDLARLQKGNTLILFNFVEKHGKVLYNLLKNEKGKTVYFIAGSTKPEEREKIRKEVETKDNCIVIGSSNVLSTGANIKNLQSLIFAHPYKGEIRNLQSIGRILRLDDKNNKAVLYDIADDLKWKKRVNYTLGHWMSRMQVYRRQKFDFSLHPITIKG